VLEVGFGFAVPRHDPNQFETGRAEAASGARKPNQLSNDSGTESRGQREKYRANQRRGGDREDRPVAATALALQLIQAPLILYSVLRTKPRQGQGNPVASRPCARAIPRSKCEQLVMGADQNSGLPSAQENRAGLPRTHGDATVHEAPRRQGIPRGATASSRATHRMR
jgi:hypothetical protein